MKKENESRLSNTLKRITEVGTGIAAAGLLVKTAAHVVKSTSALSGGAAVVKTVAALGGGSLGLGLVVVGGVAAVGTVAAVAAIEHSKERDLNYVR